MSEKITTLSDATFDEHVKSADTPVLVDFWAEWCGPCKMIAPVLEEISGEQAGKIEIAKLNIDENLDVTRRYEVMSIPTTDPVQGRGAGVPDRGGAGQGSAPSGVAGVPVGSSPVPGPAPHARASRGEAVADLQQRLSALELPCAPDTKGLFGSGTTAAVEAFQHRRGSARRRHLRPADLGCAGRSGVPA